MEKNGTSTPVTPVTGLTSGPADVIYVNESLSPARRKVLNATRALKKDQGKVIVVASLDQVVKLKSSK